MGEGNAAPVFSGNILILDGGLGTTLEDMFHKDITTPLWSAHLALSSPEVVAEAHLAFLRAGADIILTSTYQASYETAQRVGLSREEAQRIMLQGVWLANEARRRFLEERDEDSRERNVRIALSLGPYGAMLAPAQEFSGLYPPPYGPRGYNDSEDNCNAFDDKEKEADAIDALAAFHLERLQVFVENGAWDTIDFVAFETVPLLREVTAIRKAVGSLQKGGAMMKPWWISTVYPDGEFPAERRRGGHHFAICDVVEGVFQSSEELPRPSGFGINCTSLEFLGDLLDKATTAVQEFSENDPKTLLVVYPNRGDVYDAASWTWIPSDEKRQGYGWASSLVGIVGPVLEKGIWGGAIIGGCCKTGPDEISALEKLVTKNCDLHRNSGMHTAD